MTTPQGIKEHQDKYVEDAWRNYTFEELGQWVNLLTKRSTHRSDPNKRLKDLSDARNYADMLLSQIEDMYNEAYTEVNG